MLHNEREPNMPVNRKELIDKLKENRAAHKDRYDTMCLGYKVLVAEANDEFQHLLKKELEEKEPHEVDHGAVYRNAFKDVETPSQHLKDYDEVIEMMMWIKKEEVTISLSQFKMWVRDEWSWFGAFTREGELPLLKSMEYKARFGVG